MRGLTAFALFLTASCAIDAPNGGVRPNTLAITDVTVIDATGAPARPGITVLIEDDRIRAMGPAETVEIPRGALVVDASGKYLIPGLWDMHVHLSYAGPAALSLFVANGVTHVRDAGGRLAETKALRDRVAAGDLIGPEIEISGANLEGEAWMRLAYEIVPPDDAFWERGPRVVVSGQNVEAVVDSLVAQGVDFIKARNVWGEDFLVLAAAAERAGIPRASHNPNGVNMVDAARAGLDSFEHAESIWSDFDTMTVAARQRMFEQVAATEALVTPTLIEAVGAIVSSDSAISAAIADTLGLLDPRNRYLSGPLRRQWREFLEQRRRYGAPPAGTFANIAREARAMNRAGIIMLAGTDLGIPLIYPGFGLHDELELLVREAGLTPMRALQSATRNPPRFFGLDDEVGAIATGMVADLVLLDADPLEDITNTRKFSAVVLNGRYLDRPRLDALLLDAERAEIAPGRTSAASDTVAEHPVAQVDSRRAGQPR